MSSGVSRWTTREDDLLKEFWGKITEDELCKLLGRTWNGIRAHAPRLGLSLRNPVKIDEEFLAELRQRGNF